MVVVVLLLQGSWGSVSAHSCRRDVACRHGGGGLQHHHNDHHTDHHIAAAYSCSRVVGRLTWPCSAAVAAACTTACQTQRLAACPTSPHRSSRPERPKEDRVLATRQHARRLLGAAVWEFNGVTHHRTRRAAGGGPPGSTAAARTALPPGHAVAWPIADCSHLVQPLPPQPNPIPQQPPQTTLRLGKKT